MRAPVLLGVLLAATALAKPKVIVEAPAPMKALLTKVLKKKFTPVAAKSELPDEPGAGAVKAATREVGAVAIVTARLSAGVWEVMALNGADGAPLEQFKIKASAKKPLKGLPKGFDKQLEAALSKAKAPAKEKAVKEEPKEAPAKEEPAKEEPVAAVPKKGRKTEPTRPPPPPKEEDQVKAVVEEKVEKVEEAPAPPDSEGHRLTALNLGVGIELFSRRFFYKDDIFMALSKYSLPLGPAPQLELDWFPGAHVSQGAIARIGISFGFNYAVGITSVANDGTRYSTSAMRLRAALMGRLTLGPLELLPHVGYRLQSYSIANGATGAAKPNIPDVNYSTLRAGLGLKISLVGPLSVTGGFAYQAPLSTGEIGTAKYFPRLKAGGLDANVGIAIGPLVNHLELRLSGDYVRYWYSMNPEPGDAAIAGGATDDYFGGSLMIAFTL